MRAFNAVIDAHWPAFHYTLGESSGPLYDRLGKAPVITQDPGMAAVIYEVPGLVDEDNDTAVQAASPARYLTDPHPVLAMGNDGFSILCVMKFNTTAMSSVLALRSSNSDIDALLLITTSRSQPGDISCEGLDWVDSQTRCRTPHAMNDGLRHVVLATFNAETRLLSLWVDGDLVDQRLQPRLRLSYDTLRLYLFNNSNVNQPYTGVLDEVAGFNYVLTRGDIQHITKGVNQSLNWPGAFAGNARTITQDPVNKVVVRDYRTNQHAAAVVPAPNGAWETYLPPGEYDVTYFAQGCPPLCHGPYHVEG